MFAPSPATVKLTPVDGPVSIETSKGHQKCFTAKKDGKTMAHDFKNPTMLFSLTESERSELREMDTTVAEKTINNLEDLFLRRSLTERIVLSATSVTIDGVTYEEYHSTIIARYVVGGETFVETAPGHLFNATQYFKMIRDTIA